MALELCKGCGRMHYQTDKCAPRVTLNAKPILRDGRPIVAGELRPGAKFNLVPTADGYEIVTPRKRGRPATGFDKKAYDRQKAAAKRAAEKAEK